MLKTNQDRLVMQSVLGEIQHPTVKELPVRLDCDGVAHTLPNTGSITYNVKLGDSVYGLAGDHIEPGVTIKNHNAARENEALNVLSCIGNDAVVVSGDAKGAKGFVTGTHGGVEHVLIYFAREDLEKMVIGDKIQVRAYGQGLKLLDYPQVSVMNCDPWVLEKMNITEENGKLRVPVAAISPAYLMGSGYGEPTACFGDYDIMTEDWDEIVRQGLDHLRFGDIVLLQNCDTTCGRGYPTGAQTIGVIVHSDCIRMGHGPGVATLLTSKTEIFEPVLTPSANLADMMSV